MFLTKLEVLNADGTIAKSRINKAAETSFIPMEKRKGILKRYARRVGDWDILLYDSPPSQVQLPTAKIRFALEPSAEDSLDQSYRSLIVPAVLSALSLTATLLLFGKWEREASLDSPDAKPIAFLKANTEKIERRSRKRIIWQDIDEGGSIYSGDAVRTPPKAEGNVQLVRGDTIVTLEPDSLIVLDESNGRLELNLVSGSLLVDSKGTGKNPAAGPVIRSGNTRLELGKSGTQLSLSKTKGAEANVAVAKGQVEIKAGDKKIVVEEGKIGTLSSGGVTTTVGLESLSPKPNETIIINRLPDGRGTFTWKPLAGEGRVHLELGAFRGEVKDVGANGPVGAGSVNAVVPVGTFYWRLVRRDAAGKPGATSMVLRAEGVYQTPPSLYAPAAGEVVLIKPKAPGIDFSWSRPPKVGALTL